MEVGKIFTVLEGENIILGEGERQICHILGEYKQLTSSGEETQLVKRG